MTSRLQDKVILVTGSSAGIGRAMALACAREGAKVIVHGRDEKRIQEVTGQIQEIGGEAIGIRAEISDLDQVSALVKQVLEIFHCIDVLINNAGAGVGPLHLEDTPEETWDKVIAVNLLGPFYFCQSIIPIMKAQGGGKIINVTSDGADFQLSYEVTSLPYVSAKSALRGFTRQLAWLYGRDRITVNAISPGDTLTEAGMSWWASLADEERQQHLETSALGRLGQSEDVAGAAVFLASSEADYITGATLRVNGGQFMV